MKAFLLRPDEGFRKLRQEKLKDLFLFTLLNATLYSLLVSAVNIGLIFLTIPAANIPVGMPVFSAAVFAAFFAGLLLVIFVYSIISHILGFAFIKSAKFSYMLKITMASFTPVYLFTWLSPLVRMIASAAQPALGGSLYSAIAGQLIGQVAAVLFGAFSVWLLWALLLQSYGFMHAHKVSPGKTIGYTLICSIVLMAVWNLLASLPLVLVQGLLGF